jgi:hypothetical protein
LAAGCRLTQKRRGWHLFCRELKVPPFALWALYPAGLPSTAAEDGDGQSKGIYASRLSPLDELDSAEGGQETDEAAHHGGGDSEGAERSIRVDVGAVGSVRIKPNMIFSIVFEFHGDFSFPKVIISGNGQQ